MAWLGLKWPCRRSGWVWFGHAGWPEPRATMVQGCLGQAGAVGAFNCWLLRLKRTSKFSLKFEGGVTLAWD